MMFLSVKLTLCTLIVIPIFTALVFLYSDRLKTQARRVRERMAVLTGSLNEVITGVRVVRSFAQEDREKERFDRLIQENVIPELQLGFQSATLGGSLDFVAGIGVALIWCVGGLEYMRDPKAFPLGSFVAFSTYLQMLYSPLLQLVSQVTIIIRAQAGLERIVALLETEPEITEPKNPIRLREVRGAVQFENVSFSYDSEVPAPVLRGFTLDVKPGEIVALVGPSGAGKSTCTNLITRFYDPTEGRILIDGHDLRRLDLKAYRSRLGIVLQEPFLFSGPIRENICYGRPDATEEQIERAAQQANALDFILQLPQGFDTEVGERGGSLSGGQRQRISIARALLKDPSILILDEATSSLDTESERLVREALDNLMAGRTVFIIAHRLSTISSAHRIVVLDEGRIVEMGTHAELLAGKGLYHRLYYSSEGPVTTVAI